MKCGNRLLSPPVAPVPPSATATALHRPPSDNGKKGTKIKSKMEKKATEKVFKSCTFVAHGHRDIDLADGVLIGVGHLHFAGCRSCLFHFDIDSPLFHLLLGRFFLNTRFFPPADLLSVCSPPGPLYASCQEVSPPTPTSRHPGPLWPSRPHLHAPTFPPFPRRTSLPPVSFLPSALWRLPVSPPATPPECASPFHPPPPPISGFHRIFDQLFSTFHSACFVLSVPTPPRRHPTLHPLHLTHPHVSSELYLYRVIARVHYTQYSSNYPSHMCSKPPSRMA